MKKNNFLESVPTQCVVCKSPFTIDVTINTIWRYLYLCDDCQTHNIHEDTQLILAAWEQAHKIEYISNEIIAAHPKLTKQQATRQAIRIVAHTAIYDKGVMRHYEKRSL